ncbi:hypothetical protein DEIPH_ctg001orf0047 [Deinococcus phoenicis]|uniref:Uncharacterized protein n=1 Tax=Deinococcus phoenicis TaxID=1476583 RepID=A0A016QUM0_9DEIO|nr:hypothetical protein [Deinococcus phoenicis]EYB69830.1 hypothetical protein DEIPH_ctg001orf0047 [Deinococcus phoenicis]
MTPPRWSRLLAWPGMLTLLSVLAVLLGHHPQVTDPGARMTAGSVAPALPEARPAPQPSPGPAVLAATPPEPFRLPSLRGVAPAPLLAWTSPVLPRSLALLGRRQTDGG